MSRWHRLGVALALACVCVTACAQRRQDAAPILVLISFDGWRWDYIDRVPAANLRALAARGVRASELIPSFPSFTFPNHYTIVTGLYPGHHGIVANVIAEPSFPERFTMSAATARDARWWGGEPIWVTAIRQGLRAAPSFWPGAEVAIGGVRPTYWERFDDTLPNAGRVARALERLALPEAQRPAFVSVYFSEVDHAGHVNGPDSHELETAAAHLDLALGQLVDGVKRLGLEDRTTLIVVSDHGMAPVADERRIFLDDYVTLSTVDVVEQGAFLQAAPKIGTADALYQRLHDANPHLTIYKREQLPARFHYPTQPRIQPIIGMLDEGWTVTSHEREASRSQDAEARRGAHGFDPQLRSMHGLFVAAGPPIRSGLVVAPFENVHIYDLLCAILKLTPAANDGDPEVTRGFLREQE
jgi:predicted AlkP superfamily pyrophosphatase or phosphodiesterase